MGVTATDKIRKVEDGSQILPHGPSWGSIWYDVEDGELHFNPDGTVVVIRTSASPTRTVFPVLDTDPATPDDNTYWVVKEGTVPAQLISLKARIDGVTITLAAVTKTS